MKEKVQRGKTSHRRYCVLHILLDLYHELTKACYLLLCLPLYCAKCQDLCLSDVSNLNSITFASSFYLRNYTSNLVKVIIEDKPFLILKENYKVITSYKFS